MKFILPNVDNRVSRASHGTSLRMVGVDRAAVEDAATDANAEVAR